MHGEWQIRLSWGREGRGRPQYFHNFFQANKLARVYGYISYWYIGYWYISYWYISYWCISYWRETVYWYISVLVYWCIGVLVYWGLRLAGYLKS